ncbi:MAG: septum formation initiator family protein [Chromatiales bacterium]|jgi:cell division protein FtsB|nr:septum formation initiator family protein [Chromatiales bacterium]MDH4031231.1 septum formation initiator family protein [Chromatiales bacterium]
MRPLLIFVVLLFVALQYRLWISEDGWREVWGLREAVRLQESENDQLRERNQRLQAEVEDLKSGLDAAEEIARTDLGMIGSDETLYQIAAPDTGDRSEARR